MSFLGFSHFYLLLISDILRSWTIQHDGPISCLKLFCLNTEMHTPSFVSQGSIYNALINRNFR